MSGPDVIIIKKKAKGHGAHGAAWKVAYADFVTAMMALFMVLWLVSQTDQKIKKELSDYFRTGAFSGAPSVLEGGLGVSDRGFVDTKRGPNVLDTMKSERTDRTAKMLRETIRRNLGNAAFKNLGQHLTITATPEGVLIQIAEGRDDMLFDLSSAELKTPLVKLLGAIAPELSKLGQPLELHGHTDARPFAGGAGRNNWTLSFERAERARVELERSGLPPKLVAGVFAHSSTEPVDSDPNSPLNRRLAIFVRRSDSDDTDAKIGDVAEQTKGRPSSDPVERDKASPSAEPLDRSRAKPVERPVEHPGGKSKPGGGDDL